MRRVGWRPGAAFIGLCLAASLVGCGAGSSRAGGSDDPLLPPGEKPAPISQDCRDAFSQGHDREAAGEKTVVAFLPSVQRCSSVAEWTATAKARNANLNGRDAAFIDSVCTAAGPDTQARPICQEATAKVRKGTASSFLSVYPAGQPRPLASNLNFVAGQDLANLVVAKVGAGGRVTAYNNAGNVHLVADVVGWYAT